MISRERVVDVVEVEVHPDRGRGAHDAVAVERHELTLVEELEVLAIVRRLEALGVVERGEAHALECLELLGVLGPRVHHAEAVVESSVVPRHGGNLSSRIAS